MSKTVTFGAVGDVGYWRNIVEESEKHGLGWPFERMTRVLARADLLFGNAESVVVPPDYPRKEIDPHGLVTTFDGLALGKALKRAGFDVINLAANHVLDAGEVGMFHTKRTLEAAGLVTIGVGRTQAQARKPVIIEKNGVTFGFLGYCEDTNYSLGTTGPCHAYYEIDSVLEDVRKLRRQVDVLVVSIHADIEFMPTPSVPRRANFRRIARAGADIILGHHPHVPQGCERVGKSIIAYSLGNFVFPAHTSSYMKGHAPNTGRSFALFVDVTRRGVKSFRREPFVIPSAEDERPRPLTGARRAAMLRYLAKLDRLVQDDAFVEKTWRDVAKRHFAIYVKRAAERLFPAEKGKPGDMEGVLDELVGRLCLTAENRSWMDEVLLMGRERWDAQRKLRDPLHRPHYRYSKGK